MTTQDYAHPELLVDAAWVEAPAATPTWTIVDCDVDAGYARGHIPGAVLGPGQLREKSRDWASAHHEPGQFQAMCQRLGIGDDTLVIAYDNGQGLTAARLCGL